MFMRSAVVCIAGVLLGHAYPPNPVDKAPPAASAASIKLEVRGTLAAKDKDDGYAYYVETCDGEFPSVKLLVKLERSEDKNRVLDRYLESLRGKAVIVSGFLDGRRLAQENAVIFLYLSSESQIKPDNN